MNLTADTYISAACSAFLAFNDRTNALMICKRTGTPVDDQSDTLAFLEVYNSVKDRADALLKKVKETVKKEFETYGEIITRSYSVPLNIYDYNSCITREFHIAMTFYHHLDKSFAIKLVTASASVN